MPSSSDEEDEDEELTHEQKRLRKALIWARKLVARRARQKEEQDAADKKWQEESATSGTKWTQFQKSDKRKTKPKAEPVKKEPKKEEGDGIGRLPTIGLSGMVAKDVTITGTPAERALLLARLKAFYEKHNKEKPEPEITNGANYFAGEREKELNLKLRTHYSDDLDSFPSSDFPTEFAALEEERAAKKAAEIKRDVDDLLGPNDGPVSLKGRLVAFYATHDPPKLKSSSDIAKLVTRYETKATLFIEAMCMKYKVDPKQVEVETAAFFAQRNKERALREAAIKAESYRLRRAEERQSRRAVRYPAPAPAFAPAPAYYANSAQPAYTRRPANGQYPPGMPPATNAYPNAQYPPPQQQYPPNGNVQRQWPPQPHPFAPPRPRGY